MTVKNFFIGLVATFAIPWLVVIAIPYSQMRTIEPVELDEINDGKTGEYAPKRQGFIGAGAAIYAAEGCATCHTQVARPTYAGNDVFQESLAGVKNDPERGDTRRESTIWDYSGTDYAWIGETRIGPDLSNYGRRVELRTSLKNEKLAKSKGVEVSVLKNAQLFSPESYVLTHLFNPRLDPEAFWSTCPTNKHLFNKVNKYGPGTRLAVPVQNKDDEGSMIVPTGEAIQLASYLLSLKSDDEVPFSMNYRRDKTKASEKK